MINSTFRSHGTGRQGPAQVVQDLHKPRVVKPRGQGLACNGRLCASCKGGKHKCRSKTCGCERCLLTL